MKKSLVLLLFLFLVGCGNDNEQFVKNPVIYDDIPLTEEMKEQANDLSIMQENTMLVYNGGLAHSLDLNQDGEREEVLYENGTLKINNKDYSSFINDMENLLNTFTIGKIGEQVFLLIRSDSENRIFIYDEDLRCVLDSLTGSPFLSDDKLKVILEEKTDVYLWSGSEFVKNE